MGFLSDVANVGSFGLFGGGSGSPFDQGGSKSNPWGPQADALAWLYGSGQQSAHDYYPQSVALGNSIQQGGMGALNTLGQLGQVGNPFVQQQLGQLGQSYGQLFNDYINPAINSEYQISGTAGGSRQGIAQGLATDRLGQQFGNAATNLLSESSRQAIGAAGMYGNLGGQLQNIGLQGYMGPWQTLAGIFGTSPGMTNTQSNPGLAYSALNSFLGG